MAERLYHEYAAQQPIIDYHNHLPPDEIAMDKQFSNITEAWLKGDHYKWRAMRANGIEEVFITGAASDQEKFMKWSDTVPYTMRNPLYHWTHLELQRYFGINELLNNKSAAVIYEQTSAALNSPEYSTQALLKKMKVEVVCTTDEPTDSLEFHQKHRNSNSPLKMLPTFRPDKFIMIGNVDFLSMLNKLENVIGHTINTYDDLLSALKNRIDFFHSMGCFLADHGLAQLYAAEFTGVRLNHILEKRKNKTELTTEEMVVFQSAILQHLAEIYHQKGWTMQFHLGAIRNNNSRLMKIVGVDVGCDSIGDYEQATALSIFLTAWMKKVN